MNKIERARELFLQLEHRKKNRSEIAIRSVEIESRLGICRIE